MRLPNWFKVGWWFFLLVGLGVLLGHRYQDLTDGKAVRNDAVVLIVWLVLLVLPFFQEVSLFGLSFKKELEALRSNLKDELAAIRAEIRNSIDVRAQISPSIVFAAPPPDSQLPLIEKKVQAALDEALRQRELRVAVPGEPLTAPQEAEVLFRARYNIERELRRIWHLRTQQDAERRFMPTMRIAQSLAEWEFIEPGIEKAIREVWRVASPAIHGESVTPAQVAFVSDVAPKLIATLRAIN